MRLRQAINVLLAALYSIAAGVAAFFAYWLKDPHLLPMRSLETPLLLMVAATGIVLTFFLSSRLSRWKLALWALWTSVLGLTAYGEYHFDHQKQFVLTATGENAQQLSTIGQHIVIGYTRAEDIQELVKRGYVGGVFITRRNSEGKSLQQLHDELSGLQALRHEAGLPPLMLVSDQEGGMISRLSPPLPRQDPLSSVVKPGLSATQLEQAAFAYGAQQGAGLASLGINANFSPVIDLRPSQANDALDFHTRIIQRAISPDPTTVSHVALAYSKGLLSQGIIPTAKHFPGLGSVIGDTHHFSAHLTLPEDTLTAQDWVPFRTLMSETPALLMVGHVIADTIDPKLPASISNRVISGVVRERWHHQGIIVTDDMTMAAVYNRGLCDSSVRALNAGSDILLVSYDWEKVYPVLDCLLRAHQNETLTSLSASDARLAHAPWRKSANLK